MATATPESVCDDETIKLRFESTPHRRLRSDLERLRLARDEVSWRVLALAAVLDAVAAGDAVTGMAEARRVFVDDGGRRHFDACRAVADARELIAPVADTCATWSDFRPGTPLGLIGDDLPMGSAHEAGLTAVVRVHRSMVLIHAQSGRFVAGDRSTAALSLDWSVLAGFLKKNDGTHARWLAERIRLEAKAAADHLRWSYHARGLERWRRLIEV